MAIQLKLSRVSSHTWNPSRPDQPLRLTKLLVPVDFSAGAKNALRYAGAFARQFGASLTLLHVVKPICEIDFGYGSIIRRCQNTVVVRNAKARLRALGKKLASPRPRPRAIVRTGTAANQIVESARQLEMDLIIMGTRGDWHPTGAPLASTAEKVVRCAPCPVLIVRNNQNVLGCHRKPRQSCQQKPV